MRLKSYAFISKINMTREINLNVFFLWIIACVEATCQENIVLYCLHIWGK